MMKSRFFPVFALVALFSPLVLADDAVTTFHYHDLYNIQQGFTSLQDLKRLRAGLYITSALPGVRSDAIKMVIHRSSGALQNIPLDTSGRMDMPMSADLVTENPLIVTNQPKHSLKASVVVDLTPLPGTEMSYTDLMLGVQQFNTAFDRKGVMAALYASKADGLLLFYNDGGHRLVLHEGKGEQVIKSLPPADLKEHLHGIQTQYLIASTTVIYVPLDEKLLKENPRVSLDSDPAGSLPGF
jgi:hypothetical protein